MGDLTLTSPIPIGAEPGTEGIICAPGWGLRANGTAYFDITGAKAGEAADLVGHDGNYYLSIPVQGWDGTSG